MPQIKFSGLVTDMKGKAGGSVFSSNKQGAYMRNNKWGGGRKSNRWDVSKTKMAALSNSWQLLTTEQKEAWNVAAADYPFLNKFKEEYIASGYQVYMSLNGNLLANNFPLLTVPGAKRAIPDDINLSFSQPTPPWVTAGTGATFPSLNSSNLALCDLNHKCPYGFECVNGVCVASNTPGSMAWDKSQEQLRGIFNAFDPIECSTDSDCVDAGLSGASADVACSNGECVYVGDGFMNWSNTAYVLNIENILADAGAWDQDTPGASAELNGSFRFTLGPNTLRLLQTTQQEIMLVSNYYADGRGMTIRIRPNDQQTTRVSITFGLNNTEDGVDKVTYQFYADILTSALTNSTVMQYRMSLADTNSSSICVGNTGWLSMGINTYTDWHQGPISSWGTPASTTANPFASWTTADKWYGIVYGGGVQGNMTDVIYSDIRFFKNSYKEYLNVLVGYLNGDESILILANGTPGGVCKKIVCNEYDHDTCWETPGCNCTGRGCKRMRARDYEFRNAAPAGDTDIVFWAAVPIANFVEVDPGVFSYEFAGYWMNLGSEQFANNGATFVPNVLLDVTASSESGFFAVLQVTNPRGYNQNNRWSPLKRAGTIDISVNATLNLWEYIQPAIVNAPPGTSFDVTIFVVDSSTGYTPGNGKKTIRFKAGAELSSSVN